jgi:ribA/ribD-fused uncharacterized protein
MMMSGKKLVIDRFRGKYRFLSNFYICSIEVQEDIPNHGAVNIVYPSVEHAFQAAKSFALWYRLAVREADSPGDAKRMGKEIRLRPGWENIKVTIMLELLHKKFSHPDLREKLLQTGYAELIEGNYHGDREWGVCGGEGKNLLGKLLMQVRGDIMMEESVLGG